MVFSIICCSLGVIALVLGLIFDEEISSIGGLVLTILMVIFLVGGLADSVSNQREWEDMRKNPEVYSVFERHEANEEMKKHVIFKGSIFSFYNGYEFEYFEEKI